ncbi:MAG: transglutaminase N-terminal domain-containing protein [Desulfopila sp.]
MKYRITHTTSYSYSEPASLSQNELYLLPGSTIHQHVTEGRVSITPEPAYLRERVDYFGNVMQTFMIQQSHKKLTITALSTIETRAVSALDAQLTAPWETVVSQLAGWTGADDLSACQYRFPSPMTIVTPEIEAYARISFPADQPVLAGALDLMNRIFTEFSYDKSATTIDTPVDQVLACRKGVCQDFSHLMISCLRTLGLAARYVSGYLETLPPPGKPKLVGADASHAWLSLYIPGLGWIDLDPTNNVIPGEQHITIACGRDYTDVTPVKGVVMGGGVHTMAVMVDVNRLEEPVQQPG